MDRHTHHRENENMQQYKQPAPQRTHLVLPELAQSPHLYQSLPQLKGVSPGSSLFWKDRDQPRAVSTVETKEETPGGRNSWGKKIMRERDTFKQLIWSTGTSQGVEKVILT